MKEKVINIDRQRRSIVWGIGVFERETQSKEIE
jgi:hypothetical protein